MNRSDKRISYFNNYFQLEDKNFVYSETIFHNKAVSTLVMVIQIHDYISTTLQQNIPKSSMNRSD